MGKRTNYERKPRDFYSTPVEAVKPLLESFSEDWEGPLLFCEPCAGNGALVGHLEGSNPLVCILAMDIEPQQDWIVKGDASLLKEEHLQNCDMIITNPPFSWSLLKPLLDRWLPLIPCALLLPADFMHNIRFQEYLKYCSKIISIGRVKWIEGSKMSGMENYCWYFFDPHKTEEVCPVFEGRK